MLGIAVQKEECDADHAIIRDQGLLSLSCWLTFTKSVYASIHGSMVWYKKKHYVVYGPGHLFKVVKTIRHFSEDPFKILDTSIQKNAFFMNPGNILLVMVADGRLHKRELAYRQINKSRDKTFIKMSVRELFPTKFNFGVSNYIELID